MPQAPHPPNEAARLAALASYEVLDTACETTFDNIVHLTAQLTGSPVCLVSLIDAERQWFKARIGLDVAETSRVHAFCAHAILRPDEVMVVPDAKADPRFADNPLVQAGPGIRFYAGMPLLNPEGAALGTLCIIDHQPRALSDEHRQILRRLAETVMTTLELRRAMLRVRDLALVDILTGIPNRPAMIHAIDQAIARQTRNGDDFTLLYIDLDGFKQINDAQGHAAGDQVLRDAAAALTARLRAEDVAGRLGGDEFVVLLSGDATQTLIAAERVQIYLNMQMRANGWAVTASIGAMSFTNPPASASEALNMADRLMYQAKAAGKNRMYCNKEASLQAKPNGLVFPL
jgi:diguanylate cyclase (GGDEF)-like protein